MAAMPRQRVLGDGALFRPLLDFSRSELKAWAQNEGLCWVEDPSNTDIQYDRNFLRQQVLPLLAGRWSGISERLQATAGHLADAEALLEELAQSDLLSCSVDNSLLTDKLQHCCRRGVRQTCYVTGAGASVFCSVLHSWVSLKALITAGSDRQPELILGDRVIRRYRNRLFIRGGDGLSAMGCPVG